jgi:hypothetical protein
MKYSENAERLESAVQSNEGLRQLLAEEKSKSQSITEQMTKIQQKLSTALLFSVKDAASDNFEELYREVQERYILQSERMESLEKDYADLSDA